MSQPDPLAAIPCPNCRQPMLAKDLETHAHGMVRVDLCFACAGLWFDPMESVQLAPAAVIELFKDIYAHREGAKTPVAQKLNCPRCSDVLALSQDLCKSGRFSYFRCQHGDGRYTPFFQFLREKQFVRTPTATELLQVRAQVRQITCSECGAPIDLENEQRCRYCHAPVSFLDPDAVEKAMRMYADKNQHRAPSPSPEAFAAVLRNTAARPPSQPVCLGERLLMARRNPGIPSSTDLAVDLVGWGIMAIGALFEGH
jgi:hypothetical protein